MRVPAALTIQMLLGVVTVASAQVPARIEEPTVPGIFRVNPATGALIPLEKVVSQREDSYSSGLVTTHDYSCYLPGAASSVTMPSSEQPIFAMLIFGPPTLESERKEPRLLLEHLSVEKGRRYATRQFVPMEVTTYGDVKDVFDPKKKKNRPAQLFVYTARHALPPGEYAVAIWGLLANPKKPVDSFRVVNAPRTPSAPSASQAAPASVLPDLTTLRTQAEKGDPVAQFNLGHAYALGAGVSQDYQQAALWLGRAAEQGLPVAQAKLGQAHATGTGVLQDYVEAHKWLNLAVAGMSGPDRDSVATYRDQVAAMMTAALVAEAQKRAREWREAFLKKQAR